MDLVTKTLNAFEKYVLIVQITFFLKYQVFFLKGEIQKGLKIKILKMIQLFFCGAMWQLP